MCKDSNPLKAPVPPPQQRQEKGVPPTDPYLLRRLGVGYRTIDLEAPKATFLLSSCLSPQGQNLLERLLDKNPPAQTLEVTLEVKPRKFILSPHPLAPTAV